MNINDESVLEKLNKIIALNRFNKIQILHIVKLALISKDYDDLEDNMTWENIDNKHKTNIKN